MQRRSPAARRPRDRRARPARAAPAARRDPVAWLAKPLLWLLCLTPLALLAGRFFTGGLGANPVEFLTHRTGFWALVLLLCTLALTPLRRATRWHWLVRLRRPLGLFAFFYLLLHLAIWVGLDRFFDWAAMLEDVIERPYITAGAIAFLLLLPLAVTSTRGWTRRLGRRWQLLHRLVYPAAAAAVLHFFWKRSAKLDVFEPLLFAALLALLLAARIPSWLERRRRRGALPATRTAGFRQREGRGHGDEEGRRQEERRARG